MPAPATTALLTACSSYSATQHCLRRYPQHERYTHDHMRKALEFRAETHHFSTLRWLGWSHPRLSTRGTGSAMSDTYTKLFSSITESTIVSEPVATRWLWVTMLAMADSTGHVYGSIPGLCRRANLSRAEIEAAITCFLSPDPDSRTKDHDGRRIEEIDGGWRLLNHAKYRAIRSAEDRREYKRKWDQENRPSGHSRSQSEGSPTKPDNSPTKTDSPAPPTPTPKKQDQKQKQPSPAATALPDPPDFVDREAWQGFVAMRAKQRHPLTPRAAELVIAELKKLRKKGHDPTAVLDQSTRNGWRDVFALRNSAGNQHANSSSRGPTSAAERVARKNAEAERRESAGCTGIVFEGDFRAG